MKSKIILVGGGGHCKSCIDVIEQNGKYDIAGIVDVPEKLHQEILGYKIIATDDDLPDLAKEYGHFLITLGQIKSPARRVALFENVQKQGGMLPVMISPLAYVSRHAKLGEGTVVLHHALVNAGARIGINCIINSKALVEHDAVIGNHCHISTGAVINGGTVIGDKTFWGSNTMSREYITIGNNSVVGGGRRIMKSVPDQSKIK